MGSPTIDELVDRLSLEAHPEGGWFTRTWTHRECDPDGRPLASSIVYLLPGGITSRWHRVDADELWMHRAGAPLALSVAADGGNVQVVAVGPVEGADPAQHVVPAGVWQSAASTGDFTLVSCVVVPAFVWEGFELAPEGWTPSRTVHGRGPGNAAFG